MVAVEHIPLYFLMIYLSKNLPFDIIAVGMLLSFNYKLNVPLVIRRRSIFVVISFLASLKKKERKILYHMAAVFL